jgi:hypothetical protein
MGIREKLNENPGVGIALVAVVIVCVIAEAWHLMAPAHPATPAVAGSVQPMAYFTTDDGKTFFGDFDTNIAPFDHHGRPAVKAYVYSINGRQVVAYLEKHSAGADGSLLVKKPGIGNKWIADSDPQAQAIKEVKGTGGPDPIPVTPPSD